MIHYLFRHNKDYSRFNIIKQLLTNVTCKKEIYILLPFSKNQFLKHFFKRNRIVNDFFISNYDTYVYDRKKITKYNPRAWWKFAQDWINFRFSKYLLSDTQAHFEYWQTLFGTFKGNHLVLPVLADKTIYYPSLTSEPKPKIVKILFYGSFIPLHGIDIILKAFKILEQNNTLFEGQIIGNGQMFLKMKNLHQTLGLKNVSMNGTLINENELAQEIRQSHIILGIFGDSRKAHVVIPNKAYQALASKKVLITMKSDAINEFFSEKEVITCDNTPDALASKLMLLINNDKEMNSYQELGYQKFLNIYKETEIKFIEFLKMVDEKLG